jgi:hypothetical protein
MAGAPPPSRVVATTTTGRRRRRPAATTAALAAAAVLLVAAAAWPHQASAARALLDAAPPASIPGFGSLLQGMPLKDMLGAGGKAFGSWRKGKEQLAEQRANGGPDGEVVGSDPARLVTAGAKLPGIDRDGLVPRGQKQLINSSMEYVPDEKRLFVFNSTGVVAGAALPAEPKDGTFTLLPAGCQLAELSGSVTDACWSVKLEANAGTNSIEGGKAGGLVTTDSLNATADARDIALSDFARLTLRYGQLSLDDDVPGVPVPFDFELVVSVAPGGRINGTAKGSERAVVKPRMWGMWTNGEPAIPLRSAIFTLVSTNQTYPFELMGSNYTLRMLGLPLTADTGDRSQEGKLYVATPRDALLGVAALRRQLGGADWARSVGGMRVQSMHLQRSSPVKIMMMPAVVELVQPSQAMFDDIERQEIKLAEEAKLAEIAAVESAQKAVLSEVEAYKAALIEAAKDAAADELKEEKEKTEEEGAALSLEEMILTKAEEKEKEAAGDAKLGQVDRMPLPWKDDPEHAAQDAEKRARKERRQEALKAKAAAGATPQDMFARAAKAAALIADKGVDAREAEKAAAGLDAEARALRQREEEEAKAAAARGEEVYEDDDEM